MEKRVKCDDCGSGYRPEERMSFNNFTLMQVVEAAQYQLDRARLQLSTAECCLSYVLEKAKAEGKL